jgi:hypothetical protein
VRLVQYSEAIIVIHSTGRLKKKKIFMIIYIDVEKELDRILHSFMIVKRKLPGKLPQLVGKNL